MSYMVNYNKKEKDKIIKIFKKERPEYLKTDSEEEKVDIVRDWVYRRTVFALEREMLYENVSWMDKLPKLKKLGIYLTINGKMGGGMYCGGAAWALTETYALLGHPACTVDCEVMRGRTIKSSHAATLVYIDGKWIIEDATFNLTFIRRGRRLDILDLQNYIKEGREDEIELKRGKTEYRPGVTRCAYEHYGYTVNGYKINPSYGNNGHKKKGRIDCCQINVDIDRCILVDSNPIFKRSGYRESAISIFMYPYALKQMDNIKDQLEQIKILHSNLHIKKSLDFR